MKSPVVILIRPQMGENIGAVARAMSNFGLTTLRLVAPRDGWPNPKAEEMAAGAKDIIATTEVFDDLPTAMHDITTAYATTARPRQMEKPTVRPNECAKKCHEAGTDQSHIALIFGPERSGLENDELVLADAIVTIDTDEANASLNLAQASVIMGYEWWQCRKDAKTASEDESVASKEELEGMFTQLEEYLDRVDYFRTPDKKPIMWRNLRNLFVRARLREQEIQSLRGMFRSLVERS